MPIGLKSRTFPDNPGFEDCGSTLLLKKGRQGGDSVVMGVVGNVPRDEKT